MLDISLWFIAIVLAAIAGNSLLFVRVRRGDIVFYSVRQSEREPIKPLEDKLTVGERAKLEERAKFNAEQDRLSLLDGRD